MVGDGEVTARPGDREAQTRRQVEKQLTCWEILTCPRPHLRQRQLLQFPRWPNSFLAKAGLTEHLEVAWFLAKAGLTFDEADMRECGLDPGQAALVRRTLQELAAVAAEARQEKPETLSRRGKSKGKGKRQSGHGKSKDKGKHSTCNEVLVQVLALVLVLVLVLAVLVSVLAVVPVLVLVLVLILLLVLALVLILLQY